MTTRRGRWSRCAATSLVVASVWSAGCVSPSRSPPPAGPTEEVGVGYGTQPKNTMTGAVSVVKIDERRDAPIVRAEELLEGRVAGVQVLRTAGGGISVRIRGRGSINGSNEPLYVVDGMPVQAAPGRGLDWLNPGDIERIEVLKDAGATAIYGVRGANGVVLITTRRGR